MGLLCPRGLLPRRRTRRLRHARVLGSHAQRLFVRLGLHNLAVESPGVGVLPDHYAERRHNIRRVTGKNHKIGQVG